VVPEDSASDGAARDLVAAAVPRPEAADFRPGAPASRVAPGSTNATQKNAARKNSVHDVFVWAVAAWDPGRGSAPAEGAARDPGRESEAAEARGPETVAPVL